LFDVTGAIAATGRLRNNLSDAIVSLATTQQSMPGPLTSPSKAVPS
jgi:hypothetical protein